MKTIRIKTTYDTGDIGSLEIFKMSSSYIIHRHVLTENPLFCKYAHRARKFWNKTYATTVIVFSKDEFELALKMMKKL